MSSWTSRECFPLKAISIVVVWHLEEMITSPVMKIVVNSLQPVPIKHVCLH